MLRPTPWFARRAALVLVAGAGAATLVACQKPLPEVTFQSGSHSVLVDADQYCFQPTTECRAGSNDQQVLTASAGASINISVPRTIALNAWIVTANEVAQDGSVTPIQGAGSALVQDNHDTAVQVPVQSSGSYVLTVAEYRSGLDKPSGSWNVRIRIAG